MPLIVPDLLVQGARYALILFIGYYSLSLLGGFLFGTAVGSLLAVGIDFGINQHWLRLPAANPALARLPVMRVMLAKFGLSLLSIAGVVILAATGVVRVGPVAIMAAGLLLSMVHGLLETCESIFLTLHRYRMVSLFRCLLGGGIYGFPLATGMLLAAQDQEGGISFALYGACGASLALLATYTLYVVSILPHLRATTIGYHALWWNARWLGLNQTAIVVDVRAPLVILGIMLGETAVGLYGLVQRTTAVVELAWASLSKLLLKDYAEISTAKGIEVVRSRVLRAGRLTAMVTAGGALFVWIGVWYVERLNEWPDETILSLSLLRWAVLAISFSSLKRPFIAGLMALYQERAVCRVNILSAVAGVIMIPLLVVSLGIWGPVVGWIILEAVACVLLIHRFLSMPLSLPSNLDAHVSETAGL